MGGNALKQFGVGRLPREEYFHYQAEVLGKLKSVAPTIQFLPVKAYQNKPSFGDMDIVYASSPTVNVPNLVIDLLKPEGYEMNGTVLSFLYQTRFTPFQVDIIKLKPETFNFGYHYHNFSLGNLLGRVYHKAGFKLSHEGLKYIVRDPDNETNKIAELTVTRYWMDAMQFMGYQDYFLHRFDGLEDLFKFTVSSPFSNKDIYLLENRNHISRIRDRKRPTYTAFLKWLESDEIYSHDYDWSDKELSRTVFLDKAFKRWPKFKLEYEQALDRHKKHSQVKDRFNGNIVRDITGLQDKELGHFITRFKEFIGGDFETFIIGVSDDHLKSVIMKFFSLLQALKNETL